MCGLWKKRQTLDSGRRLVGASRMTYQELWR